MSDKPLKIGLVGAGHRGILYIRYAAKQPDKVKIWAIAEPNEFRRNQVVKGSASLRKCFHDAEEMAKSDIELDAVVNGTMDQLHVATTLPLLERGWDVLLEKPICTNEEDLHLLYKAAKKTTAGSWCATF